MTTVLNRVQQQRSPMKMRMFAVHNGVLAAIIVWVVEVHVLGIHLGIRFGTGAATTLGLGQIIGVSLAASLAGWALLAIMERKFAQPRVAWTVIAVGALVLSLGLPFAATTTAAMVGLIIMHLSVGAGVIPFMYWSRTQDAA
ncbi:MAG: DUF6069 family protein [Ferrimicrobium sp.]|jgi:hypothetical protein|nr:DUF6069 family protein [Ferrimicrobium sp.]